MTPIVNWKVGWWEATQTCAKKGDNEFSVGNSEETRRKHLDSPIPPRNETDPDLISLCGGVFSRAVRRAGLGNLGAIPGTLIHRLWAQGKGVAPIHLNTPPAVTNHRQAQEQSCSVHTQKCALPNTYLTRHNTNTGARDLTHFSHSCTHTTHRRATRELTHARAHVHICAHTLTLALTPSCACTYPHSHTHTARAPSHPEYTPSGARTYPSAHTLTPLSSEGRGGRPLVPGPWWPGEGAARWTVVDAGVVCPSQGVETPAASPASSGCTVLGGPEGACPRSRRRPREGRGRERAMDRKEGAGEEDECVDSGAETGG